MADAYRLMRAALALFDAPPAQLEAAQRQRAEAQAEREADLERRILATPEAAAVAVSEAQVAEAVATIEGRFADAAELERALAANGLDREALAAAAAEELRVEGALEQAAVRAEPVTDADLERFYREHPERFRREQEARTVRHILITLNDDYPENRRDRAWSRAERLAAELQAAPEGFAAAAQRYSECPSALHDGLIGQVTRGQLHAELDAALFAMAAGEVRGPVETAVGLHVLLCEAVHPPGPVPLEAVRERLRERLQAQRAEQARRAWVRALPDPSATR